MILNCPFCKKHLISSNFESFLYGKIIRCPRCKYDKFYYMAKDNKITTVTVITKKFKIIIDFITNILRIQNLSTFEFIRKDFVFMPDVSDFSKLDNKILTIINFE